MRLTDLFNGLGHELDEALAVLFGVARADAVHVGAVLDRLRCLGRLLLDAVVREHVDDGHEVYLFDGRRIAAGYRVDVQLWYYISCNNKKTPFAKLGRHADRSSH